MRFAAAVVTAVIGVVAPVTPVIAVDDVVMFPVVVYVTVIWLAVASEVAAVSARPWP